MGVGAPPGVGLRRAIGLVSCPRRSAGPVSVDPDGRWPGFVVDYFRRRQLGAGCAGRCRVKLRRARRCPIWTGIVDLLGCGRHYGRLRLGPWNEFRRLRLIGGADFGASERWIGARYDEGRSKRRRRGDIRARQAARGLDLHQVDRGSGLHRGVKIWFCLVYLLAVVRTDGQRGVLQTRGAIHITSIFSAPFGCLDTGRLRV